jgi:hypothetical protein
MRAVFAAVLLAAAGTVVVGLGGCGTTTMPSGPAPRAAGGCQSTYVDWLQLSGAVTCDQANQVATAIFMGDDGNTRTSFLRGDFAPLPTLRVAGVGYLPTRVLGSWHCRYSTRRSSYDAPAAPASLGATGAPRLVSATCRFHAGVVAMTTAMDERAGRRYI